MTENTVGQLRIDAARLNQFSIERTAKRRTHHGNASGRMQSGMEAVDLLTTKDQNEAYAKGKNIDQYNRDRKELDKRITEEANAILEERGEIDSDHKSIVIYNKNWHKGIIGIVASRLTELYYKPAVVLTLSNGLATGSSRSVQGYDIYSAVEATRDLLENFGGHTYAVGLSLKEENIRLTSAREYWARQFASGPYSSITPPLRPEGSQRLFKISRASSRDNPWVGISWGP